MGRVETYLFSTLIKLLDGILKFLYVATIRGKDFRGLGCVYFPSVDIANGKPFW